MSDEAQLIAELRENELASVQSEAAADRLEHILRTLDERGTAQELIRQQYTGRYPFELLQNADDASVGMDRAGGTVRFQLTDHALVVADCGSGFRTSQIKAICGLGRSSKDPSESIGYKGLGFKSVGEISDSPQVLSLDARFTFSEVRARDALAELVGDLSPSQRLPVYAFPFELELEDLGPDRSLVEHLAKNGYRSIIRFPLKPGVTNESVDEHLQASLSPHLLLFLGHTDRLQLVGTSRDFDSSVTREIQADAVEALLDIDGDVEHWLTFRREVPIEDSELLRPLGEGWARVEHVTVAAAVRLGEDGRPAAGSVQPLHVYFPTVERSGLPLVLHADFALELDRRHVSRTPEAMAYNLWLVEQLAELVARAVAPALVSRFPADASVVEALAPVGTPSDFGEVVFSAVIEQLRRARFVPCIDGSARLPAEASLLPSNVPSARDAHRFLSLTDGGRLVIPDIEEHPHSRRLLCEHFGTEELALPDVLATLREPAHEPEERDLFRFLVKWSDRVSLQRFAPALAHVPAVRTVSGTWAAPSDGLFFPRKREALEFPPDLDVPVVRLPEVEGLEALLQASGVRPFEWRQLLPEFVLPLLTSDETDSARRSSAIQALRSYYDSERGDQRIQAQVANCLLPATNSSHGLGTLRPAGSLYFSAQWLGNDRLERVYGPFDEPDFVAIPPPNDADQAEQDLAFYGWMGVSQRPRIDRAMADQKSGFLMANLTRHPHRRVGGAWERWLQTDPLKAVATCDQNHGSQQLRSSYMLDRLADLVEAKDTARLAGLWEAIADDLAHYEPAMTSEIHCQHGWHSGAKTQRVPSLFRFMLDELPWVPCFRAGRPTLSVPQASWRLSPDTPRHIAERVDVLAPAIADRSGSGVLAAVLGVVDAARPDADDLIRLLNGLAGEQEGSDEPPSDVYEAARWAMRTLNDVLDRRAEVPPERPKLLARFQGRHVFHPHPVVANDPLLEETWEPVVPILDADRDLRRLHGVFELRNLDEAVLKVPVAEPLPDDRNQRLQAQIRQAMPFLAALAVAEAPSREDEVFRGLSRLEVVGCLDLRLRYELDGVTRTRDEAVSFIAVRLLTGGRRRQIGTAYLEIDPSTETPHWYVFGPQLARFLNVPTQADAFALLLAADRAGRERFLTSRRIPLADVDAARTRLDVPEDDDDLSDLLPEFDSGGATGATTASHPDRDVHRGGSQAGEGEPDDQDVDKNMEIQFPEVDLDAVVVDDPETAPSSDSGGRRGGGSGSLGPAGPVDFDRKNRNQHRIGRRGEEIVLAVERRQLEDNGMDPAVVVWRSERNPFAPYDVESLAEDGQRIYIEVKSTTSSEPTEPFEISEAELRWAVQKADRYFIYRVTDVLTAVPRITRFADPIGLLRRGHAALRVSGARMAFETLDESKEV